MILGLQIRYNENNGRESKGIDGKGRRFNVRFYEGTNESAQRCQFTTETTVAPI